MELRSKSLPPWGGEGPRRRRLDTGTGLLETFAMRSPAGREGTAGSPQEIRPPFSFVLTKENAPRPVEEKTAGRQNAPFGAYLPKYDGRANRSGGRRQPRRPCDGSGSAKNCAPAFDGAAEGRGGKLNRRISIPARSALLRAAGAVAVGIANGCVPPEVRCVPGQRADMESAPTIK